MSIAIQIAWIKHWYTHCHTAVNNKFRRFINYYSRDRCRRWYPRAPWWTVVCGHYTITVHMALKILYVCVYSKPSFRRVFEILWPKFCFCRPWTTRIFIIHCRMIHQESPHQQCSYSQGHEMNCFGISKYFT